MGSKSVKMVIIIAVILGILAIVGITALVVSTTKSSEPRVIDLNDDIQTNDLNKGELDNEEENNAIIDDNDNESNPEEEENNNEENTSEFNNASNPEAGKFNSKFENYEGDRVSSEKVNELLNLIWDNNDNNQEHKIKPLAKVQNWDSENTQAVEGCYYTIGFERDNDTGYINALIIKDAD